MKEKYLELKEKYSDRRDEYNPIFIFQSVPTELLAAITTGELDAKELAEIELMNRGRDEYGKWIGFDKAEEYWQNRA